MSPRIRSRARRSWARDEIDGPSTALAIPANSTSAGRRSVNRSERIGARTADLEQAHHVTIDADRGVGERTDPNRAEGPAVRLAALPAPHLHPGPLDRARRRC